MLTEPVQVIPGSVTEALDYATANHWGRSHWRLVLVPEDLTPNGRYVCVGGWHNRLDPQVLAARLAELNVQPIDGWAL